MAVGNAEQAASVAHDSDAATPVEDAGRTEWPRILGIGLGLAVLIGVLVTAFAWPAVNSEPRDVPIAIVGPDGATAEAEGRLAEAMPGAFEAQPADDAQAARELILEREVYGAIVLQPGGVPEVLVASGASPVVAQTLQGVATGLGQTDAIPPVLAEDIAPLPDGDARGAGFAAAALPMVIGGMVVAIAMSFLVTGVWRRVVGALFGAAAAGLVVGMVAQGWLGVLAGNYWANAGAVALTVAAIAMTLIGLIALLGVAGIPLGAIAMFLVGNPLSGVASAPEMLPSGLGILGQMLPPGSGGTLLRSTAYFDGAAAGGAVLVLSGWLAIGLVLAAAGRRIRPASQHAMAG